MSKKAEHPILFSTPMVQAILENRKTQTRRVVNTIRNGWNAQEMEFTSILEIPNQPIKKSLQQVIGCHAFFTEKGSNGQPGIKCPYGQPGDLLWVRETWMKSPNAHISGMPSHYFKASVSDQFVEEWPGYWKPSIHMPKAVSRIWNEIGEIKVERIADISEEDCIAEGVKVIEPGEAYFDYEHKGQAGSFSTAKGSFASLWQSINCTPKPIQSKIDGRLQTTGYIVYPFNKESAKSLSGLTEWRGKPLTVIINPWVWVVKYKVLSTTGKPVLTT